jgi:hypothetical protein
MRNAGTQQTVPANVHPPFLEARLRLRSIIGEWTFSQNFPHANA